MRAHQEKVQSNEKLLDYNSTKAGTVFQDKKAAELHRLAKVHESPAVCPRFVNSRSCTPLSSVGGVKTKEGSFPLPKKQGVAISETEVTQRLPERTVAGSRAVRKTF